MEKKELKKITLGGILSWVFGVFFGLWGLVMLTNRGYLSAVLMFIFAVLLLPPFKKIFREKFNFELASGLKVAIGVIGFIVITHFIVTSPGVHDESITENHNTVVVSDALNEIDSPDNTSFENKEKNDSSAKDSEEVEIKEEESDPGYFAGDRVEVGNFAYTINSYYTTDKIGESYAGQFLGEIADGIFLVIDVTIENIGKESQTLFSSYIEVEDDQGRIFEHDSTAEIYLGDEQSLTYEQLQPGLPKTGKIVFDVPKNIKGSLKISSDIMFSDDFEFVSWNQRSG